MVNERVGVGVSKTIDSAYILKVLLPSTISMSF